MARPKIAHLWVALALAMAAFGGAPRAEAQTAAAAATYPVTDEALAEARGLVQAMHIDRSIHTVLPQYLQALSSSIFARRPGLTDAEQHEILTAITDTMADDVVNFSEMVARTYAQRLAPADLRALRQFMESPSGQAYIAAQPALAGDGIAVGQAWAQTLLPQVTARVNIILRSHNREAL